MLVDLLGLPKQLEVLLIITAGITCLSFDSSLFYMKSNLEEIWNYDYHPKLQEYYVEIMLKYILTGIVFIRTFTTHIFLALYIVLLWPAIFVIVFIFIASQTIICSCCFVGTFIWYILYFKEERPNLIVPWLIVGSVRAVAVNVVTLLVGSYVCIVQKGHHPICLDYFVSQIIDHGPSLYAWLTIYSYYKTLQDYCCEKEKRESLECQALRRRRAKYMDSSHMNFDEKADDGRNLLSESTLANLLHRLKNEPSSSFSRSLDSLLKLKSTKEAKDEILYNDMFSDEEPTSSILERALKLLNIEDEYVIRVIRARALSKDTEASSLTKFFYLSEGELEGVEKSEKNLLETSSLPGTEKIDELPIAPPVQPENEIEITSISLEAVSKAVTPKDVATDMSKTTTEEEKKEPKETPKPDFLEKVAGVMQSEIKKMTHFGCQVGVLNRAILKRPSEEVKKKLRLSKRVICRLGSLPLSFP